MQSRETFHSQRILPNRFYRRSRKEFCFLKLLVPVGKSPLSSCFFSPQRQKKKWICPSAHESQCVRSVSGQALLLRDALSLELLQHVVQVAGVRVAVARQVGAKLCLMVDLKERGTVLNTCIDPKLWTPMLCCCVRTSFQMTVSDSPVVLEVPTEKINLRSHATRSSLST